MTQFLPKEVLDKVEQDLKQAIAEHEASLKVLSGEKNQLEEDLVQAVENKKIADVRKKLQGTI